MLVSMTTRSVADKQSYRNHKGVSGEIFNENGLFMPYYKKLTHSVSSCCYSIKYN